MKLKQGIIGITATMIVFGTALPARANLPLPNFAESLTKLIGNSFLQQFVTMVTQILTQVISQGNFKIGPDQLLDIATKSLESLVPSLCGNNNNNMCKVASQVIPQVLQQVIGRGGGNFDIARLQQEVLKSIPSLIEPTAGSVPQNLTNPSEFVRWMNRNHSSFHVQREQNSWATRLADWVAVQTVVGGKQNEELNHLMKEQQNIGKNMSQIVNEQMTEPKSNISAAVAAASGATSELGVQKEMVKILEQQAEMNRIGQEGIMTSIGNTIVNDLLLHKQQLESLNFIHQQQAEMVKELRKLNNSIVPVQPQSHGPTSGAGLLVPQSP